MAVKKWPQWIVGISSVLSFVGFLYVTQDQQGTMAQGPDGLNANEDAAPLLTADASLFVPVSAETNSPQTANAEQTKAVPVKAFLHSRTEFQELEALTPEAKAERQKQLEQLDWDANGSLAMDTPPVKMEKLPSAPSQKATTSSTTAPKAAAKPNSAATVTLSTGSSTKVNGTTQQRPKSDRTTRRS